LLRADDGPDLRQEDVEVLRLDRDHDQGCVGYCVCVRQRRLHAELFPELVDALLPSPRRDDLARLSPATAEQAGDQRFADRARAEHRNPPFAHRHPGI